MDLIATARRLESRLARTLDDAAHRAMGRPARDPLAILHAVVEAVERELQPAGRGRRVFPFNSVAVTLAAASPAERARYEAVLDCGPALGERIAERLRAAGADAIQLDVRVNYAKEPLASWSGPDFHVEFARVATPVEIVAPQPAKRPPIQLAVLHGAADQASYLLSLPRIDLGRGAQVRSTRNHLVRTNQVAFVEGGGAVNTSVSRRHAHIAWDAASRGYRIHDDGSTHGTHVLRNGTTIVVRTGARGTRLRDGDEIALGEARIRVTLPGVHV